MVSVGGKGEEGRQQGTGTMKWGMGKMSEDFIWEQVREEGNTEGGDGRGKKTTKNDWKSHRETELQMSKEMLQQMPKEFRLLHGNTFSTELH